MDCPTFADVLNSKKIANDQLVKDLLALKKWKPTNNGRCFAGNKFLYHFQLVNLCDVKLKNGSFKDIMDDDEKRTKLWEQANKYANGSRENNLPMRLFELWRRLNGAIVFFRPTVAKYVYTELGATHVLDPTAGWGGRAMAAWANGIAYTGFDTNENLRDAYEQMFEVLGHNTNSCDLTMRWESSLDADFSEIDYDCVLTSPPYLNLELYPGMTAFEGKKDFYETFLIPLISKCRKHIKRNGWVCFNISPAMYKDLTVIFKYPLCERAIEMYQQKVQGIDKKDKIYCWRSSEPPAPA
jgi:hypothetical protein